MAPNDNLSGRILSKGRVTNSDEGDQRSVGVLRNLATVSWGITRAIIRVISTIVSVIVIVAAVAVAIIRIASRWNSWRSTAVWRITFIVASRVGRYDVVAGVLPDVGLSRYWSQHYRVKRAKARYVLEGRESEAHRTRVGPNRDIIRTTVVDMNSSEVNVRTTKADAGSRILPKRNLTTPTFLALTKVVVDPNDSRPVNGVDPDDIGFSVAVHIGHPHVFSITRVEVKSTGNLFPKPGRLGILVACVQPYGYLARLAHPQEILRNSSQHNCILAQQARVVSMPSFVSALSLELERAGGRLQELCTHSEAISVNLVSSTASRQLVKDLVQYEPIHIGEEYPHPILKFFREDFTLEIPDPTSGLCVLVGALIQPASHCSCVKIDNQHVHLAVTVDITKHIAKSALPRKKRLKLY